MTINISRIEVNDNGIHDRVMPHQGIENEKTGNLKQIRQKQEVGSKEWGIVI